MRDETHRECWDIVPVNVCKELLLKCLFVKHLITDVEFSVRNNNGFAKPSTRIEMRGVVVITCDTRHDRGFVVSDRAVLLREETAVVKRDHINHIETRRTSPIHCRFEI